MLIIPKSHPQDKRLKIICEENGVHKEMQMDISLLKLHKTEKFVVSSLEKESAILLIHGQADFYWYNLQKTGNRENPFDHMPFLLHVPRNTTVEIHALQDSELLLQQAENHNHFEARFFAQEDCVQNIFDDKSLKETAKRYVRDIVNFQNSPYSHLVIGEVINFPGKWSSYPSHSHDQPEVYYYKFTKPQGFGACFIGDDAYKIRDGTAAIIPGGLVHPQVAAPGYGMYYCWMIRHLENNPWTTRIDEPAHRWLRNENAIVWPDK